MVTEDSPPLNNVNISKSNNNEKPTNSSCQKNACTIGEMSSDKSCDKKNCEYILTLWKDNCNYFQVYILYVFDF